MRRCVRLNLNLAPMFCTLLLLAAVFGIRSARAAAMDILWPSQSPEWGLLLNPGAQRRPDEYVELAKRIQQEAPVPLAVGIAHYAGNWPEPFQMTAAVKEFKKQVSEKAAQPLSEDRFLIAGHSMAGIILQEIPAHEKLGGVILMAAYPSNDALRLGNGLRKSNIPTLILAGEWDGLTRITRVLDTILDCEGLEPDHPDAKRCAKQRVIVLPGVNHSDFANGVSQTGDMDAELDVATAHTSIARAVAGYWNEILLDRPFGSLAAREQMPSWQSLVSDTRSWAVAWAKMDHLDATSCLETQKKLLPNDLQSSWEVAVKTYESVPGFTFAKPSVVETSPGHFKVTAIQSQDRAFNPLDLSSQSRAFQRLSCKLKSEMALRQVVADSQRRRANPPDAVSTCGALNNALYQDVLSQLPPELVSRLERRGAVLSFGEDLVMSSGPQWISAKPKRVVDSQERRAVVSVPRLQTGANAPLHLDGMHYCQLVSPTQLAEWLFFDGFKVLQPQKK